MASERSVDHPVPSPSSALHVGSAASVGALRRSRRRCVEHPVGTGGGRGCPFDGSRMAHAKAGPIAGRGSDRRFAEALHERPSASANGFRGVFGFTTAQEGGGLSFGRTRTEGPSAPRTGNRDSHPPAPGIVTPLRGQKWRPTLGITERKQKSRLCGLSVSSTHTHFAHKRSSQTTEGPETDQNQTISFGKWAKVRPF
jgi:hypothetical protein